MTCELSHAQLYLLENCFKIHHSLEKFQPRNIYMDMSFDSSQFLKNMSSNVWNNFTHPLLPDNPIRYAERCNLLAIYIGVYVFVTILIMYVLYFFIVKLCYKNNNKETMPVHVTETRTNTYCDMCESNCVHYMTAV